MKDDLYDYVEEHSKTVGEDKNLTFLLDNYKREKKLDEEQSHIVDFLSDWLWENQLGNSKDNLSAKHVNVDPTFNNDHVVFPKGYKQVIDILKQDLRILTSIPVKRISYSDKVQVITENEEVFEADRVIVTVPLAILQKELIKFEPELPSYKKKAINQTGCGMMDKLVVLFDG